MGNTGQARVRFEGSQPSLRVENMEASLRFYVDVLGFENAECGSDDSPACRATRRQFTVPGRPGPRRGMGQIGVEDAEKLHEECKARGATIRLQPTNYPWALEMQVEDPDGNVLRFGSEPL